MFITSQNNVFVNTKQICSIKEIDNQTSYYCLTAIMPNGQEIILIETIDKEEYKLERTFIFDILDKEGITK